MTRAEYIRRKNNRRKRILRAYAARAGAILVLAAFTFLICCGCIYVRDTFFVKKTSGKGTFANVGMQDTQTPAKKIPTSTAAPETKGALPEEAAFTVTLDAGHGGNDSGTFSGTIVEKDITLQLTEKMKALLEEKGLKVVMTREEDVFVDLSRRTEISDEAESDMFVSIHCNSYEDDSSVSGLECYYCEDSAKGKEAAECIIDYLKGRQNIKTRSARAEDYYVVKHAKAPAVLIETGFMTNRDECAKLVDEEYQELLAKELTGGILEYLGL